MKEKKIKTYVITLSKTYMKGYPKAGQPTNFREKFLNGEKIHTIRGNYELWAKRIKEVQEGKAILSIRQWIGKPYNSKQEVVKDLTANDSVGLDKIYITDAMYQIYVNGKNYPFTETLATNDGLDQSDFEAWFYTSVDTDNFQGAIIQFTGFRY